jgi:uncharacterized protein
MAEQKGIFLWVDLTVTEAEKIREFYSAVIGWTYEGVDMGGYEDYSMKTPNGEVVAGICHNQGVNANIPPCWINYISVESVKESTKACLEKGGKIIEGPRKQKEDFFAIIQDPAGAHFAIYGKE